MEEKGSNKDADGIQTFRAFGNKDMDHGPAVSHEQLLGGSKACGEEGFLDSLAYRSSEAMINPSLQPNVVLGLSTAGASREITNICNKKEGSYEDRTFTYRSETFTPDTKDFGFLTSNMSGNTLKLRNDPQVLLGKQAEKNRQEIRQQQIQQWVLKHNFSQDSLPSDCWPDKYPQITAGCENENPETVDKLKNVKFASAEENRRRESSSNSLYNEGPKTHFAKSGKKHVQFLSDNSIGDKSGTLHASEGLCVKRRKLTDTNDEAVEGYSRLPLVIPEQHYLEENAEEENGHCMSLRQWLNRPHRVVDCYECLHIFKQILEFVEWAHTQGVALRNVRPSSFVLSSLHRVSFVDSASSRSSSGSSDATTGGASGHTSFLDTATQSEAVSVPPEGKAVFRSPSRTLHRLESAEVLPDADAYGSRRSGISQALTSSEKLEVFSDKDRPEFATWRSSGPSQRSSLDSQKSGSFGMKRTDDFGPAMSLSRGALGSKPLVSSPKFDVQENVTVNSSQLLSSDKLEQDTRFPVRPTRLMEETWYASPEEILDGTCTYASDIYSLGVLFFELFSSYNSWEEYLRMMSDLRHRILPPRMLSERPKEAAFCLWLLHPDANARPQPSEIMHSEILNEAGEALAERQTATTIEEREEETGLLLDFLLRVQLQKQELAGRLKKDLSCLTSDVQEVKRRRAALKCNGIDKGVQEDQGIFSKVSNLETSRNLGALKHKNLDTGDEGENEMPRQGSVDDTETESEANISGGKRKQEELQSKCARLMSNFDQLEQVYFAMRWKVQPESCSNITHSESKCTSTATDAMQGEGFHLFNSLEQDYLGCFFDSLCKYARYSRFEVKATLRHGDLMNTANMVCSLGFDRDQEYFATAGVCRRIKVFECDAVLNENVDIHFPVIEMVNKSMLSSICWNSYVKSHIASSDYDGVVQLWDASTGKSLMQYKEHEKRAWSVDFSQADPTKLASGSDDGRVKIWSINQEGSIATIKTSANVCCIQFPRESAHLIAFGSADYKIYIYDLRNPRVPWFTLASHSKAVSYVKFLDASTLVSASTDNTLKLWDLSRTSSDGGICENCLLTYTGHTNEKNFVGLSVMDGYIACGSETNSVFAYHKSLPMPMASHRFGCVDPVSGHDAEDDTGQFVSSVCWRGKSQTLVAANSKGNIKVLEMV